MFFDVCVFRLLSTKLQPPGGTIVTAPSGLRSRVCGQSLRVCLCSVYYVTSMCVCSVYYQPVQMYLVYLVTRGNMEPLSESNFGLGISEIFEFRSIGNRGISSRNLGVSVRHLESWNIFGTFLAILEFRSIRCF